MVNILKTKLTKNTLINCFKNKNVTILYVKVKYTLTYFTTLRK